MAIILRVCSVLTLLLVQGVFSRTLLLHQTNDSVIDDFHTTERIVEESVTRWPLTATETPPSVMTEAPIENTTPEEVFTDATEISTAVTIDVQLTETNLVSTAIPPLAVTGDSLNETSVETTVTPAEEMTPALSIATTLPPLDAEKLAPLTTTAAPSELTYNVTEDPDHGIRYYLYTRKHPVSYELLGTSTQLDNRRPTTFLIHGFTGSGDTTSVTLIKNALLYSEDINVISVHWEDLAKGPDYELAANNAVIVAEHLAKTIKRLVTEEGVRLKSITVIGFSLGAQVAGMAGSRLTIGKLPRLVALDPAGPTFHKKSNKWRLDASDAEYVLVLHTSGGFVSFDEPLGHADFYPNGGQSPQPPCKDQVAKLVCSHLIAPLYFTEAIYKPKAFAAYSCESYREFLVGTCALCKPVYFGPHTPSSARGKFFLMTAEQEPYGLGTGLEDVDNNLDNGDTREGRTVDLREEPLSQATTSKGLGGFFISASIGFLCLWTFSLFPFLRVL